MRFGFERLKEPGERTGWLINMHPVSTCAFPPPAPPSTALWEEWVPPGVGTCSPGEAGGQGLFAAPALFFNSIGPWRPWGETRVRGVPVAHKNKPFKDEGQVERNPP